MTWCEYTKSLTKGGGRSVRVPAAGDSRPDERRSVKGKEASLYGGLVYLSKSGILILFPLFIADSCAHIPAQV